LALVLTTYHRPHRKESLVADATETQIDIDPPLKKGSPLLIIIVIVNLLLVGGLFAYILMRGQPVAAPAASHKEGGAEEQGGEVKPAGGALVPMVGFLVNLLDRDTMHYLKFSLALEVADDKVADKVKAREAVIRDGIIGVASSQTFEQIGSPEGKQAFRKQIMDSLSESIGPSTIKAIYFTDLVVQ
jgi:flagellar basal body-associated protein FliL